MATTIQKQMYLSVFPSVAIAKIGNVWRICRGHYIDQGGGQYDIFIAPYMGQIIQITYPDFRVLDLYQGEETLYQTACDYNVSELAQEVTRKKQAEALEKKKNDAVNRVVNPTPPNRNVEEPAQPIQGMTAQQAIDEARYARQFVRHRTENNLIDTIINAYETYNR